MLIVPYVCAEFHDKKGALVHKINPQDLRTIVEVPDSLSKNLFFKMLTADGSIKAADTTDVKKKLENDPGENMAADGKAIVDNAPAAASGDKSDGSDKDADTKASADQKQQKATTAKAKANESKADS